MKIWKIDNICIGPAADAEYDNTNELLENCLNGHERARHCIREVIEEKPGNFKIIYTCEEELAIERTGTIDGEEITISEDKKNQKQIYTLNISKNNCQEAQEKIKKVKKLVELAETARINENNHYSYGICDMCKNAYYVYGCELDCKYRRANKCGCFTGEYFEEKED